MYESERIEQIVTALARERAMAMSLAEIGRDGRYYTGRIDGLTRALDLINGGPPPGQAPTITLPETS